MMTAFEIACLSDDIGTLTLKIQEYGRQCATRALVIAEENAGCSGYDWNDISSAILKTDIETP